MIMGISAGEWEEEPPEKFRAWKIRKNKHVYVSTRAYVALKGRGGEPRRTDRWLPRRSEEPAP